MIPASDDWRITIRVDPVLSVKLNKAVNQGGYFHVSEYIREALREKLERDLAVIA